jgi:hypothetical protein
MRRLAILATLCVAGFLAACVGAQQPETLTLERLRDNRF